jgi:DNA-binding transcriptional regulator YdaS (Cro superfamily)
MTSESHPLKQYLTESAETQAEFAERIGASQAYVSRICAGNGMSIATAVRIAEATAGKVTVEALTKAINPYRQHRSVAAP